MCIWIIIQWLENWTNQITLFTMNRFKLISSIKCLQEISWLSSLGSFLVLEIKKKKRRSRSKGRVRSQINRWLSILILMITRRKLKRNRKSKHHQPLHLDHNPGLQHKDLSLNKGEIENVTSKLMVWKPLPTFSQEIEETRVVKKELRW